MKPKEQCQLIRRKQVLELLGIKRTALDEAIARGDFPRPIRIFSGGRAMAWPIDDVWDYIARRRATRYG